MNSAMNKNVINKASTTVSLLMMLGLVVGCSASGLNPNKRPAGGGGGSSNKLQSATNSTSNTDSNDPKNENYCNTHVCQSDNNQTQNSGVNLVSFDNVRPRCDFISPKNLSYDIYCRTVAIQSDMTEAVVTPADLSANPQISLAWSAPVVQSGAVSSIKCTVDSSSLGQTCSTQLPSNSPTTLDIALIAGDSNLGKKNQTKATISLPFSVGVAAGMVANAAMGYSVGAGFSPLTYQPQQLLINPTSVCSNGQKTFFTNGSSIWESYTTADGRTLVQTFAGSFRDGVVLTQSSSEDFKTRFGVQLGTALGLACYVDAQKRSVVLVSDATKNRILKITESTGAVGEPQAVVQLTGSHDGNGGYSGDGGIAASALISLQVNDGPWATRTNPSVRGIAIVKMADGKDCQSIVFADTGNHRIRKIASCDEKGVITTIAGTGVAGFSLDGTLAKSSAIDAPQHVGVGKDGSIYFSTLFGTDAMVALYPNQTTPAGFVAIRKIKPDGKLITELGPKSASWDSVPGTAMSLAQLPDLDFGGVVPIVGMAVASDGTLYASAVTGQYAYGIIRKTLSGAVTLIADVSIPTVLTSDPAARPQPLLSAVQGLAVDAQNNLLIADQGTNSKGIRQISSTDTQLGPNRTVIGRSLAQTFNDTSAKNTRLAISGMAFDDNHNIIAASDTVSIRQIFTSGTRNGNICTRLGVIGSDTSNPNSSAAMTLMANICDPTTSALSNRTFSYISPSKIAVASNGVIYFTSGTASDDNAYKILRLDTSGNLAVIAGNDAPGFIDGPGSSAKFGGIQSIAIGPDQALYVADTLNHRIRKVVFAANGAATVSTVVGKPSSGGVTPGFNGDGGLASAAVLNNPVSIAVDPATPLAGKAPVLYFIDQLNGRVRTVDTNGVITSVIGALPAPDLVRAGDAAATKTATATIKLSNTAAEITVNNSGLPLYEQTEVSLTTSGKLPTGVVVGTRCFVANLKKNNNGTSTFNLTAQQPNGNPASQLLAASGAQSGIHTLVIPQPLFMPKYIAITSSGELYVVDNPVDTRYRLSQIKWNNSNAWTLQQLFPLPTKDGTAVAEQMQMCGFGKINNTAASTDELRVKLQANLATMCVGADIVALAAKNTCDKTKYPNASQQRISIAFAQRFVDTANNSNGADNIIQLQYPCDN